jgi:hypothetical protein
MAGSASVTFFSAATMSRSRLVPGKRMTADFIV